MFRLSRLCVLLSVLALTACTTTHAVVNSSHDGFNPAGKRFAFVFERGQINDDAFKRYSTMVANKLEQRGMVQDRRSNYLVMLNYGSMPEYQGRRSRFSGSLGVGYPYGSSIGLGYGVGGYPYRRHGGYYPYGYYGSPFYDDDYYDERYVKFISMKIIHGNQTLYEGSAESKGNLRTLEPVADCLITALFRDFPGSGSGLNPREYSLKPEECSAP